jgi:hypothetical protein
MKPRLKTPADITARQSQCTRCVISQKSKHIQHRGERCRGPVAEPEPEAQAKAPPDHPKPSLSTTDSVPSRTHKLQRPPSQRSLSAACIAGTKLPAVRRSFGRSAAGPSVFRSATRRTGLLRANAPGSDGRELPCQFQTLRQKLFAAETLDRSNYIKDPLRTCALQRTLMSMHSSVLRLLTETWVSEMLEQHYFIV